MELRDNWYGGGIWSDESFLTIYFYLFDNRITSNNKNGKVEDKIMPRVIRYF